MEPPDELLGDLLEGLALRALGVVGLEVVDGHDGLRGGRLVARRTRGHVVEAEGVHSLGILDEGAAAVAAAELVEQLRGGVVFAVLELAAGVEERHAVFARGPFVVVLRPLEERRGALPLLLFVVLDRLGVDLLGIAPLDQGVDARAPAQREREQDRGGGMSEGLLHFWGLYGAPSRGEGCIAAGRRRPPAGHPGVSTPHGGGKVTHKLTICKKNYCPRTAAIVRRKIWKFGISFLSLSS